MKYLSFRKKPNTNEKREREKEGPECERKKRNLWIILGLSGSVVMNYYFVLTAVAWIYTHTHARVSLVDDD